MNNLYSSHIFHYRKFDEDDDRTDCDDDDCNNNDDDNDYDNNLRRSIFKHSKIASSFFYIFDPLTGDPTFKDKEKANTFSTYTDLLH